MNAMNKVIQLLESTKQKQEEAMKQLPKMVDEHVATVAVEGEQFINEIDHALLVLSKVVGQSEQLIVFKESVPNRYFFFYEGEEDGWTFEIEAKDYKEAFDLAYDTHGPQVEMMMCRPL